MNRREFIKNSIAAGTAGLGSDELFAQHHPPDTSNRSLPILPQESANKHYVYAHLLDPREHPDYTRRHVQPPNWEIFNGQTQFTALRQFNIQDGQLINYAEKIERYTRKYELGDVLWLRYPTLFTGNLEELVDEVQRRKLFLFDIWGYVPGSGPGGPWQQFQIPPSVPELLQSKLGDRWLGMDNGEQDGRYIGGYAAALYPASGDRFEQYLNFQRHFERLTSQLGNKMATLISCNFGHYFLKEGLYTLIGAETAQGLPNGQVFYSFLRGAGKQYGVLWFGNASVYNRWGWKHYGSAVGDYGPSKGTSLSLMKRLMYSQIFYNSVLVGFESGFFMCGGDPDAPDGCAEDELSPIGLMQQAAGKWLREIGQPGPMLTPFALMVDFLAGWTFPRRDPAPAPIYRVWGNLPYSAGDYLTDGMLDMLYPGYQNSSFFHDESGFHTATPYGDAADCLLSDAPGWLLERYPVLLVAGELQGGVELRDKFENYITNGGHLLITAGNLPKFPKGLAGIQTTEAMTHFPSGTGVRVGQTSLVEENSFDLCKLTFPAATRVLAEISGVSAAIELSFGKGRITVLASPFGVTSKKAKGTHNSASENIPNELLQPLAKPYPLLNAARTIIHNTLRSQMLFDTGDSLSVVTCRNAPGDYLLAISNPTWQEKELKIISNCGQIESMHELALDQSEKSAVGYMPEGLEKTNLGVSDQHRIAGGDLRIFFVRVIEDNVEEIAHIVPSARPCRRVLPLRGASSIKEQILARPTFFEHFDSAVIDWRYLHSREEAQLQRESEWIGLQRLNLVVDLTSGINLFPDLRLVDNLQQDYSTSLKAIEDVIAKMEIFSSRDLILSLHRIPENNFSDEQTWLSFEQTLRVLSQQAAVQKIKVHLRLRLTMPPAALKTAADFVHRVNAPNLYLAPSTTFLFARETAFPEAMTLLKNKVGLWLMNGYETDIGGNIWNENAPIRECKDIRGLAEILTIAPDAPLVFDAVYKNHDEEYLDTLFMREVFA